jgi:flagellar hook-basal body complex protein FliE
MNSISNLSPAFSQAIDRMRTASAANAAPKSGVAAPAKPSATDFSSALSGLLEQTSSAQRKAGELNKALQMDAPNVSLEQTVVAMNEASLQFQLLVQTRNKLVQAYNDVMNMPV